MDIFKLIGKLYHARLESEDAVTDFAIAAEADVTDELTMGGEVVFNTNDGSSDENDTLFNLNGSYILSDVVTLRGLFETVGEDFNSTDTVLSDLEEDNNYDKYNVGADFALNANNTVTADYTLVDADKDENKNKFEVGLENTTGKFTNHASVEFTQNDDYDENGGEDVTLLTLGTKYAMSDATTIAADLVNKSADAADLSYTYLVGSIDHKLSDNISWINEVQLINGEIDILGNTEDAEGNSFKSQLSVSF